MTRQRVITVVLAIILIGAGLYVKSRLETEKEEPQRKSESQLVAVLCAPIELVNSSVNLQSNGVLMAKNKIDIVSRVSGIFKSSDRLFRSGVAYRKGETLLAIDNEEYRANLRTAKAQLLQSMTAILADLKFDYPESYEQWNAYVQSFDVEKSVESLPLPSSPREKAFINGKSIVTQYYTIKAEEVKSSYYRIRAPFSGTLTSVAVNEKAFVNAGQKLGALMDPSVYELELKINPTELDLITIGKTVSLSNNEGTKSWGGKVTRINELIDAQSQSALVIVELRGEGLREGMYLQAEIPTVELLNVVELPRSLLIDEEYVFVVEDSLLRKKQVDLIHVGEKNAFIQGLEVDASLVQKPVSGGYDGMKVNPIQLTDEEE
ncbi:HlyD family efflux transporter periplasmic adaptor subunit [Chitinophagales bacterium]|nr:HlyD family efflux transporter periplasmic adaptor subunit [Chitinophagales bacterium]